jgi:hypothetical protein
MPIASAVKAKNVSGWPARMRDILVGLTAGTLSAKVNLVALPCALDKRAQLGCCQGGCGAEINAGKVA